MSEGVWRASPGRLKDVVVDAVISSACSAYMHVHTYTHGTHKLVHFHNTSYLDLCAADEGLRL